MGYIWIYIGMTNTHLTFLQELIIETLKEHNKRISHHFVRWVAVAADKFRLIVDLKVAFHRNRNHWGSESVPDCDGFEMVLVLCSRTPLSKPDFGITTFICLSICVCVCVWICLCLFVCVCLYLYLSFYLYLPSLEFHLTFPGSAILQLQSSDLGIHVIY